MENVQNVNQRGKINMSTLLMVSGILFLCFIAFGIGVLFFGKTANREACGSVPHVEPHEDCPSQKAGLCPVEDLTGVVKMAKRAQVSYRKDPSVPSPGSVDD